MNRKKNLVATQEKIFLEDYKAPTFLIKDILLEFYLDPHKTKVIATYSVTPTISKQKSNDLVLNGKNLELLRIFVNDEQIDSKKYILNPENLIIPFFCGGKLKIETIIDPSKNTNLSGLYLSKSGLYTQCEAEGFRNITYFIDRPDILAKYTVHLHAPRKIFPVLLSNGNLISESYNDDTGILSRIWEDPFPKPCYLFALVAADLSVHEEKFTTFSGKKVLLQFYTHKTDIKKIFHALEALKNAINWDEERNNLKLDLNRYMVVAVPDFNSGAMENKGLNLFNTKYVLADKDFSTDIDYESIRAVIGHEYFHNWTGNRITCRDWFQLTLKEGLTVFREQEFITDFNVQNSSKNQASSAKAVKRIEDVKIIKEKQFPEDASPMAHPIRPNSYSEIGNFYTTTVYEKGAEVIRMLHTIFGENGFQKGMDSYIKNFDGSAATCEDFVKSLLEANGREDLFHIFMRWFDSKGTPVVEINEIWNPKTLTFTITLEQKNQKGLIETKPLLIPIRYKFINAKELAFPEIEKLILFKEVKKTLKFYFPNSITCEKPQISLFRNFSAPVNVIRKSSSKQTLFQLKHDCDLFNKWDATQKLYMLALLEPKKNEQEKFISYLVDGLKDILQNNHISESFKATILTPPHDNFIIERLIEKKLLIDPNAVFERKNYVLRSIALTLKNELFSLLDKISSTDVIKEYKIDPNSIGKRQLKNLIQIWLSQLDIGPDWESILKKNFYEASNMTDRIEALKSLLIIGNAVCDEAFHFFYKKFHHNDLALDKWISLQIESKSFFSRNNKKVLVIVEEFLGKNFFTIKNPNRVFAVLGTFFFKNLKEFHSDAKSYQLWAREILLLDEHNSQMAARLSRSFDNWQNYDHKYQGTMKIALEEVLSKARSRDVIEVINCLLEKK